MNFKDWLLWKAKTAGERSDLYHKKGRSFISAVEAGKEEAYREVANSKFVASHQADPADPQKCPECGGPVINGIETHSPFCIKNILGE